MEMKKAPAMPDQQLPPFDGNAASGHVRS